MEQSLSSESNDRKNFLIDTHMHIDDEQFKSDQELVIERAIQEFNVRYMINIGYNRETIISTLSLVEKFPFIFAAIGWHPNDANSFTEEDFSWLKEMAQNTKVVAIGEIGLDYYWDSVPRAIQHEVFRKQIRLAKEINKPIVIHNRDAHQDVLQILKEENAQEVGGVMHSFSGSYEMAKECLKLGFYLSFSGPVTFKNAKTPKEVVKNLPIDRILVETDSPYLTPEPWRGKRNEPGYVFYTAKKIAELKELPFSEVMKITSTNAIRAFHLPIDLNFEEGR